MKIKNLRHLSAVVGTALGLTEQEARAAADKSVKAASILKNVDRPQEFIDYVISELQKRGITGDVEIEVISAAAGRKEVTFAFEPIECVPNRDSIKVLVQHGDSLQAFYTLINPLNIGVDVVCQRLGIREPKRWNDAEADSGIPLAQICADCEQAWRRDFLQNDVVLNYIWCLDNASCTEEEFDVVIELTHELATGEGKMRQGCRYVAKRVLLETNVVMQDEQNNYLLDRRGKKLALSAIRQLLSGSVQGMAPGAREKVEALRTLIETRKTLLSLKKEEEQLETELTRAQSRLEQARRNVVRSEQEVQTCQQQQAELAGKIEAAKAADVDPSSNSLLQHLDETQIASLWK
ncbi:MAG: hypothetical protein HZB70_01255 [Candidatus Berkelbacteria bacterium]|nr:MAG: hypothetical protein HZB70_01255 [Candidatus Berkelbacteria bacterium]QQG52033.1 MAG: hypothetical protein HY845_01740 [Candidatus Berkelbacteria bacterium]